jgi:uncharacterized membrane-anchored protein YjiN (DUF445 family)
MVEHAELGPFLARILTRLQETLRGELREPGGHLAQLLEGLLEKILAGLRGEPRTRERLDAWARRSILELAQANHTVIGDMVAASLAKLSDLDLVAQIESKVGADLQYIRLNGAVVGSLVGMALATLKLLLGR